ncbi:MAG: cytochrome c family protein [Alphaproteobacteria bacterium]|nr:cytochrome c family protein [Alphaproteobacteria bacterium]
MDFYEFNKFAGGLLLAGIVTIFIGMFGNTLVPKHDGGHGAELNEADMAAAAPATRAKPAGPEPIIGMLAEADIARGESITKKCTACHTFDEGGAAKQGPNLYNIVGADIAGREGFSYSNAMAEQEGDWTYDSLNAFLFKPRGFIKGTKMNFVGLKKARDRADLIAYMRSLSASPQPLPESGALAPAKEGATEPKASLTAAPDRKQVAAESGASVLNVAPGVNSRFDWNFSLIGTAAAAESDKSLAERLAAADPEAGKKVWNKCKACHTIDKGGKKRIGPNLWNIVGADVGAREGFKYSKAMLAFGGQWTYERLDAYLTKPRGVVKGGKMAFVGLKKAKDRANVIAFMRLMADEPQPLP